MSPQGWCPSTYRLYEAGDGLLARVKVPGGMLTAAQLTAVAEAARRLGNGIVEVTNRANLQLRGLAPATGPALRALLEPVGLAGPTAEADDRRNVLASPTAGLDPTELLDVRPVVAAVVAALDALPHLVALPHKFGIVIDGGGRPTLRGRAFDLGLGAISAGPDVVLEIALGRPLPRPPALPPTLAQTRWAIPVDDAAAVAAAAARVCAAPPAPAPPGRMAEIVGELGRHAAFDAVATVAEIQLHPLDQPPVEPDLSLAPLRYRELHPTVGRLSPDDLESIAEGLRGDGGEARLTPWRTILVPDGAPVDRHPGEPPLAEVVG